MDVSNLLKELRTDASSSTTDMMAFVLSRVNCSCKDINYLQTNIPWILYYDIREEGEKILDLRPIEIRAGDYFNRVASSMK